MEPIDELIQLCISSNNTNTKIAEITNFVQQKEFVLVTDFDGRTPLHFLATRDNIEAIKYLLIHMPDLNINHKDDMGWTALSNACYLGTLPMIVNLLAKGANPSFIHFGGKTLLHLVAGNTKMSAEDKELAIDLLIKKGVNPEVKDLRGQTYKEVLHFDQAKDLVATGVDPFGRTILHWAAYSFEAYKNLYEVRKDLINNLDDVGRTPLMYAAAMPKPNISYIEWLISQGCSVTHQDKGGKTAIHFAARWGNREVLNCLLENDSDPLISDHMEQTAINIARRYAPQIVPVLEERELSTTFGFK
jgi:ankyrin repeat protein